MSTANQPKPVPAILVFGTPTSPELTQASWFRAEDKQAAKAAAETLKFSVIELNMNTDAEKALTLGVHEGVLKDSGRMIVGSVSSEVYRRIEDYVRKGAGADVTARAESIAAAGAKPLSEQNTNISTGVNASIPASANAAAASPDAKTTVGAASSGPATASAPAADSKPVSAAPPVAAATGQSADGTPPNPWDTLRIGSSVLAAYWNERGKFEGFWLATVNRIDKGEFTLKWSDAPEYPPFKNRPKNIAILHPDFSASGK
jgi:hypothetical protein